MNVPVATAKEWREKFFELYPNVKQAMEDVKQELKDYLHVRTMMGRKRRFPDYNSLPNFSYGKTPSKSRRVRQAFNFKIQGFSADQVKIAAAQARRAGLKIILIVHDEIVVECKKEDAERTAGILKSCMERAVSLSIPFVAEVKIGNRYSELK
jgi:DNA polymerase-1